MLRVDASEWRAHAFGQALVDPRVIVPDRKSAEVLRSISTVIGAPSDVQLNAGCADMRSQDETPGGVPYDRRLCFRLRATGRLGYDESPASDRDRYDSFRPLLASAILEAREYRERHDMDWCVALDQATRGFVDAVVAWRVPLSAVRPPVDSLLTDRQVRVLALRVAPKV
jgi:hypothetical protein